MQNMYNLRKRYICISIQSTAQMKYWNCKDGWEKIVLWANGNGYDVYDIDKHTVYGNGKNMNSIPKGAKDKTGKSIKDIRYILAGAECFVGISSGWSWMAWAMEIPCVLISGCTPPYFEFTTGVERIYNPDVCNGCLCDTNVVFDRGDWMFCPYHKDTDRQFECTKTITSTMVIAGIKKILGKS